MRRVGRITVLSLLLLAVSASVAAATIVVTIDPANAPSGTHVQSGTPGCSVASDLTVTCNAYELAGVGHTNADATLVGNYTATIDCRNHGGQIVETHEEQISPVDSAPAVARKNGRMNVPGLEVGLPVLRRGEHCPNPNWTPEYHPGSPVLVSFTYTLVFDGFSGAYITITGP
jgi:hypothetical protein